MNRLRKYMAVLVILGKIAVDWVVWVVGLVLSLVAAGIMSIPLWMSEVGKAVMRDQWWIWFLVMMACGFASVGLWCLHEYLQRRWPEIR